MTHRSRQQRTRTVGKTQRNRGMIPIASASLTTAHQASVEKLRMKRMGMTGRRTRRTLSLSFSLLRRVGVLRRWPRIITILIYFYQRARRITWILNCVMKVGSFPYLAVLSALRVIFEQVLVALSGHLGVGCVVRNTFLCRDCRGVSLIQSVRHSGNQNLKLDSST